MTKTINMVLDRLEAQQNGLDIGPNGTSLNLLQAVYRDPAQHLTIRMRAASMAIPFEHAKLLATAVLSEGSFAELLDKAIERSDNARLIETVPVNEEKDLHPIAPAPEPILPNPVMNMVYSTRFRRRF
jgi:hypothetical protein